MNEATKSTKRSTEPSFHNRIYRAQLTRTSVGSPIIKIVPLSPRSESATHRLVSAFLYDLASEMEKRSHELDAEWVVCPDAGDARIVLELGNGTSAERERADAFVAQLLAERNLA